MSAQLTYLPIVSLCKISFNSCCDCRKYKCLVALFLKYYRELGMFSLLIFRQSVRTDVFFLIYHFSKEHYMKAEHVFCIYFGFSHSIYLWLN